MVAPPTPQPPLSSSTEEPGSAAGARPNQLIRYLAMNRTLLVEVARHLDLFFRGGAVLSAKEVLQSFFNLARYIDNALSWDDIPAEVHLLPPIIKQVFKFRSIPSLQYAVLTVLASAKNACKNRWFIPAEADEILRMANEASSSFCLSVKDTSDLGDTIDAILKIMPRFFPQLRFCRILVSYEAKHGYAALMADFQIPRNLPPDEIIHLFVVQTDNIETSSCIISPKEVSFLVNGKGIEGRTNCSIDIGPQFPTDISKMIKLGTNIFQAIGFFSGNYMIAIVSLTKMTSPHLPRLEDYARPLVTEPGSDSDVIEGPSRISINCPISLKRIKTPTKGHLCKHHQCFDYDNFIEINKRKPSWRCPCCNTHISCIDLRLDQNMAKVLREVGEDISSIIVSADGSWQALLENKGPIVQQHNDKMVGRQDNNLKSETSKLANVMDLTTDEDSESDREISLKGWQSQQYLNSGDRITSEKEDRKQLNDIQNVPVTSFSAESVGLSSAFENPPTTTDSILDSFLQQFIPSTCSSVSPITAGLNTSSFGASETNVPTYALNPVQTDAVAPHTIDDMTNIGLQQASWPFQNVSPIRQLGEDMQFQQSYLGVSAISKETIRPVMPGQVTRTPVDVQALPASKYLVSPVTNLSGGFDVVNNSLEIEERQKTPLASSLLLPSVKQVTGLADPNFLKRRQPVQEQLTGAAVSSPMFQGVRRPEIENTISQFINDVTPRNTKQQLPRGPSPQIPQNSGSHAYNLDRFDSFTASQQAGEAKPLRPGAAINLSANRVVTLPFPAANVGQSLPSVTSSEMTLQPPGQDWRPTGRMRGSLSGAAYSAALRQYLDPPAQNAHSSHHPTP